MNTCLTTSYLTESQHRLYEKLYRDLGSAMVGFLENTDINEIMVNPDGQVWTDSMQYGQRPMFSIDRAQAFSIINDLAGIHNFVVNERFPRLEAELPFYKAMRGERFTGQVPPIVAAPSFTIRKKSSTIFTLQDYIASGRLTNKQADVLSTLVAEHKNILVCGGPGSGKTTVTNALIINMVEMNPNQRVVILEDLPELRCSAANQVSMLTSMEVTMQGLLRAAMRMRPDRILIGEVRGGEALDMLKAWNTGCPGGICTIHANDCKAALQRVIDLAMEAGLKIPPYQLVKQTIDAVVSVDRVGHEKGFIQEILSLEDVRNDEFIFKKLA